MGRKGVAGKQSDRVHTSNHPEKAVGHLLQNLFLFETLQNKYYEVMDLSDIYSPFQTSVLLEQD